MTDAHCHVTGGDPNVREFLIGRDFIGVHPWEAAGLAGEDVRRRTEDVARCLASRVSSPSSACLGVGEIGLDRLRDRTISPQMRELFEVQLELAFKYNRPVVLHGAKCWGQVVKTVRGFKARYAEAADANGKMPAHMRNLPFLFHGFSRSDGLIPDIVDMGGYISVGPAVLNDHAVNYRELVKKIPLDRLLVETDRTPENAAECPSVAEVAAKLAEIRGVSLVELERQTDGNAEAFCGAFARTSAVGKTKAGEGEGL